LTAGRAHSTNLGRCQITPESHVARKSVKTVRTVKELRGIVSRWRKAGETVALVPTMGALHEGHLALVELGKQRCDRTVASIFVNPTQFAPTEDLARYPRDEAGDLAKLAGAGCDLVWAPGVAEMYPDGFATRIVPAGAAVGLESDFRPHFFGGVATVCCKLFTQVGPDIAVFGEKDYQQLQVVTQMARDLDLPLRVIGVPTVREPDGLAMSSRNVYLDAAQRQTAPVIHRAIVWLADEVRGLDLRATPARIDKLAATAGQMIIAAGFDKIDYVAVRDAATLAAAEPAKSRPLRVLAAAWLGRTRLIDNVAVGN
jgi:pantoate--beta-alanine ligase